jgi:hypothetical protein
MGIMESAFGRRALAVALCISQKYSKKPADFQTAATPQAYARLPAFCASISHQGNSAKGYY